MLGRTRAVALLQQQASHKHAADSGPKPTFPLLKTFLSQYIGPWLRNYLNNIFRGRFSPYPTYTQPALDNGIYPLSPATPDAPIRLALAGDWANGTQEAYEIAEAIRAWQPDYTLHLGDVYYVGDQREVDENFLGTDGGHFTAIQWPRGTRGEFALLGNHEMYAGGWAYFQSMLPSLRTGTGQPQKSSFFALETECWRIVALDTGYNSAGLPILGSIPWINTLPFVRADCRLEKALLDWLGTVVQPRKNPKPTLLLSHHQYTTAFPEAVSAVPGRQLAEFFPGQEVVWIWAHEHRVAIYDLCAPATGLSAFGRCIGHGGMPVTCSNPAPNAHLAFYDPRCDYPLDDHSRAGWNGWLEMTLDGPAMNLVYRDLRGYALFTETFLGAPGGALTHTFTPPTGEPSLQPAPGT